MAYLQFLVALAALSLFLLFLLQPFLVVRRMFVGRPVSFRADELGPDDVDPERILDLGYMPSYSTRIGRDRFGRMIYRSGFGADERYFYFDRKASEATRGGRPTGADVREGAPSEARLEIGWKGFTGASEPWEVLGVSRDATASQIKGAYRSLIAKFHPDRFQNLTAAEVEGLERDAKLINAADAKIARS